MRGAIIGDIVGSPYEFNANNIKTTDFPLFNEKSYITDDSIMTCAVAEEFAVARVGYDIARGFVRVGAGDAGSHLLHRGELRFEDGVVYLLLLFAYGADCDGSRHVAVVSADDCAVVHGDEVAAFNSFVRGHAVRHR